MLSDPSGTLACLARCLAVVGGFGLGTGLRETLNREWLPYAQSRLTPVRKQGNAGQGFFFFFLSFGRVLKRRNSFTSKSDTILRLLRLRSEGVEEFMASVEIRLFENFILDSQVDLKQTNEKPQNERRTPHYTDRDNKKSLVDDFLVRW